MASTLSDWIREANFEDILFNLEQYGWFHFVFPFLLVYAVVFTVLNKVEIFDQRKPVKVIVAMVFSFFAVVFPISDESRCGVNGVSNFDAISLAGGGCTVGDIMISLFPGVTAFSIAILALYIIAAMLGVDLTKFFGSEKDAWIRYVLGFIGVLVVLYYFALGFGWDGFESSGAISEFFKDPLLYIIIVFGLFFWFVSRDTDEIAAKERLKDIRKGKEAEGGHH